MRTSKGGSTIGDAGDASPPPPAMRWIFYCLNCVLIDVRPCDVPVGLTFTDNNSIKILFEINASDVARLKVGCTIR